MISGFQPMTTSSVTMRRMKTVMEMILEMRATEAQSLLGNDGVTMRHVYLSRTMSHWFPHLFSFCNTCVYCFRELWREELSGSGPGVNGKLAGCR